MATEKQPRKRRRGEGTVFKRNGVWVAEASLGRDSKGKRLRVTAYGKTISQLNENLANAKREALSKSPVARKTMTVAGLLDEWYESVKGAVSEGTAIGYDEHVRLHLKPGLGDVRLIDLEKSHLEKFVKRLSQGANPLSPAMVRKVFRTLRAAIIYGVDMDFLSKDPSTSARKTLPKRERVAKGSLTPEQAGWLLSAVAGERLEALLFVAIDSGCRMGELLALTWRDYDPVSGTLNVRKSLSNIRGRLALKETKTTHGTRSVILSFARDAMEAHRAKMEAEGRDVAAGIIFCDQLGGHIQKSNLSGRFFKPVAKRAGLPDLTFHGLRHSSASLLLAAGVDVPTVSKRLGHASPAFTLSTYAHAVEGLQASAADQLKTILTLPQNGSK